VKVRVTDHVNLRVMSDTTICQGDTIQLRIASDAFQYSWSPVSQVISASSQNPIVITSSTTPYIVIARIGSCSATETVNVKAVSYPKANAGPDTTICYHTAAQLNAGIVGNSFTWSPTPTLINSSQLNPIANPSSTTTYNLVVFDTRGCPKPGIDQVTVTVLPPILPGVLSDTTIIIGQPLQLTATGGTNYSWSPSIGLSNANIANPIATFTHTSDSIRYKVKIFNQVGCYDSASLLVKIFKTLPTVFVPNAFTPDGDRKNDFLKPIAVGMKQIEYFNVYNRWGQLVFSTAVNNHGWDGTLKGKPQTSGIYVWSVKAIDYTGKTYFQKGTANLIR
jgi:gliding motility-associated-like protein